MQKTIYMLTVTRGTRSRYFYGEKLKDALAAAGLRTGEKFTYAKFVRGAVANAKLVRPGVYATV